MDSPQDTLQKLITLNLQGDTSGVAALLTAVEKYNKTLKKTEKASKKAFNTSKVLGGALRTSAKAAGVAIGLLGTMLKRTGDTMIKFQISSIGASASIDRLTKSYRSMTQTSKTALVSLQDVAVILTEFQSKGMAERIIGMGESFKRGIVGFQEIMTETTGSKGMSKKLFQGVIDSLVGNRQEIEKVVAAMATGDKDIMLEAFRHAKLATNDLGNAAQAAMSGLDSGKDSLTAGAVAMNKALASIGTMLGNLEIDFVKTFGRDIAKHINALSKYIQKLFKQFRKWGGINKLVSSLKPALVFVIGLLTSLGKTFLEAGTLGKGAMVALGVTLTSSTLKGGLASLIKQVGFLRAGLLGAAAAGAGFAANELIKYATGQETYGSKLADRRYGSGSAKEIEAYAKINIQGDRNLYNRGGPNVNKRKAYSANKAAAKAAGIARAAAWQAKKIQDVAQATDEVGGSARKSRDYMTELVDVMSKFSDYDKLLDDVSSSFDRMESVIETLGPSSTILGKNISDMISKSAKAGIDTAFTTLKDASEAVAVAQAKITDAQAKIAAATTSEESTSAGNELTRGMGLLGLAIERAAKASKTIDAGMKAQLASLEKSKSLIQSDIALKKADLDVSQQLYGTPKLAVDAQLNLVKLIEQKRQLSEQQVKVVDDELARQRARKVAEEDLVGLIQLRTDKQAEARDLQAQELKQVKELRDGYLDAVKAQALGAGMFSKILITQDQNLMRGLQQDAIKKNYLLGQYAADAARTTSKAYRFSATGMGQMETLGGGDASGVGDTRIAGIGDATARKAAQESTALARGAAGMRGTGSFVDQYTQSRIKGAGMLGLGKGGNPPGQTGFGAGVRGVSGADPRMKNVHQLGAVGSGSNLAKQGTDLRKIMTQVGKFLEDLLVQMSIQRSESSNRNEGTSKGSSNAPTPGS